MDSLELQSWMVLNTELKIMPYIWFYVCHFPLRHAFSHVLESRIRTNTNPNDTEANAAGRSGNARALRKQNKCGVNHEGEGHWPKFS